MCSQWGIIHFFTLLLLDVRFRRRLDVAGCSCFWDGNVLRSIDRFCMRTLPRLPQGAGLLTFLSVFLILIYLFCYFKAIYESENFLCKMEGVLYFSLKGGTSLSEEKKAGCTRLAGSDRSQRRFACCHSQRKMPPLPRSQSATLPFCVPDMYPSQGSQHVYLDM